MSDAEDSALAGSSEHDLPRSTVNKLISDALDEGIGSSKDVKELIATCAKDFITLLAAEANEIAEQTPKKTMNPEHIAEALKKLGFENYAAECEEFARDSSEITKNERQRKGKNPAAMGMTDEELAAEQERLFAAARAKMAAGEA